MIKFTQETPLAVLQRYCADNNIHVDGHKGRKISYLNSIEDYRHECGEYEPAQINSSDLDPDISKGEQAFEETSTTFAPLLLLVLYMLIAVVAGVFYLTATAVIKVTEAIAFCFAVPSDFYLLKPLRRSKRAIAY